MVGTGEKFKCLVPSSQRWVCIYLGVCIYVSMSLFLTNEGQNLVLVINFSALLHDTYSELIKEETLIICENFMTKKPSYWIQGYSN